MKKIIFILLIFISSCTTETPVTVISPPDTTPMWPQFGYDARHTGNPNSPKVPLPPIMNGMIEWCDTVTNNYPNDGSECAVDSKGNIYFLSTGSNEIIKYNSDGQKIWKRDTLRIDAFCGVAISTDESQIYYGDFESINCRDSSGNLIWRINEWGGGNPIIDSDENIYFNSQGYLTKVSPQGIKLWTLSEVNGVFYSPVFDRDYNIYLPAEINGKNAIVKLDKNGRILWSYNFNSYVNETSRSVVIDGYNNIYFVNSTKLYCLNKDGILKWSKSFIYNSYSAPAITKDNKVIAKFGFTFTMLDTAGNTIWSDSSDVYSNESNVLIDDEDNIYYNYWHGVGMSLVSLNKIGTVRWNLQNITNGFVIPSPVLIPGGRLFTYPKRPARVYCIK